MNYDFESLRLAAREADEKGHHVTALTILRRIADVFPEKSSSIAAAIAENLRLLGRFQEAWDTLALWKGNSGQEWLVELQRGQIEVDRGRALSAEKHFREAVRLNPNTTVTHVFLASNLRTLERLEEANDVLLAAESQPGDYEEVMLNLGLTARAAGRLEDALEYLKRAESSGEAQATDLIADIVAAKENP